MLAKLVPILLALFVMGAVLGIAALMLVVFGQDWDDALFWILGRGHDRAGLLVVIDARHHPLRPGDDRVLPGPRRDLRAAWARR